MGDENAAMARHLHLEQAIAYANSETDAGTTAHIAAHLDRCGECAGIVARYRLVAATIRGDDALAPSPRAVSRARALFSAGQRPARDVLAPLRRIVAELVFDSHAGLVPSLAGFRGGGDRHVTYVAAAVQVDLHLQAPAARGETWLVHGQIDADDVLAMATVDVVHSGEDRAVVRATTDEHGAFALEVPEGRYDLLVRLQDIIHVLPGMKLG